jgi:hypothetical protein
MIESLGQIVGTESTTIISVNSETTLDIIDSGSNSKKLKISKSSSSSSSSKKVKLKPGALVLPEKYNSLPERRSLVLITGSLTLHCFV